MCCHLSPQGRLCLTNHPIYHRFQASRAPNMATWMPLLMCSCLSFSFCHMHQVALVVLLKALIYISDPHLTARIIFLIPLRWHLHHIPLSGDVEVPGKHDDNKPFDKDNKMLENRGDRTSSPWQCRCCRLSAAGSCAAGPTRWKVVA